MLTGWLSPKLRSSSKDEAPSWGLSEKKTSTASMRVQHSPKSSFFDNSPRRHAEKKRLSRSNLKSQQAKSTSKACEETASQVGTKSISTDRQSVNYAHLCPIQQKLWDELGKGIAVIKHSRRGAPKKKILFCNEDVDSLLWQSDDESDDHPGSPELESGFHRSIKLKNVISVRLGTAIDPLTSQQALTTALKTGHIDEKDVNSVQREKSRCQGAKSPSSPTPLLGSVFRYKADIKDSLLFGTANLRRSCPWDRIPYTMSLILADRTLDIECICKGDLKFLYFTLSEYVRRLRGEPWIDDDQCNTAVRELKRQVSDMSTAMEVQAKSPEVVVEEDVVRPVSTDSILKSSDTSRKVNSFSQKSVSFSDDVKDPDNAADTKSVSAAEQRRLTADDHKASDPFLLYTAISSNSVARKAKHIGWLLAEQNKKYGTNMFVSVELKDESEIQQYLEQGLSSEEALLRVFERKFVLGQKQAAVAAMMMLREGRRDSDDIFTSGESYDSVDDRRLAVDFTLDLSIDVEDVPDVYVSTASNSPSPNSKASLPPTKKGVAELDPNQVQHYMDQGLTYSQAVVLLQSQHASNMSAEWLSSSHHTGPNSSSPSPRSNWKPPVSPNSSYSGIALPPSSAPQSNRSSLSYSPMGYAATNQPHKYFPTTYADAKIPSGKTSPSPSPPPLIHQLYHVEQSFYGDVVPMSLNDSFFSTRPAAMYEASAKSNSTSQSSINSSRERMYKSDSDDEKDQHPTARPKSTRTSPNNTVPRSRPDVKIVNPRPGHLRSSSAPLASSF